MSNDQKKSETSLVAHTGITEDIKEKPVLVIGGKV
jgi:hypothetical protein